jgi:hypothetical protein
MNHLRVAREAGCEQREVLSGHTSGMWLRVSLWGRCGTDYRMACCMFVGSSLSKRRHTQDSSRCLHPQDQFSGSTRHPNRTRGDIEDTIKSMQQGRDQITGQHQRSVGTGWLCWKYALEPTGFDPLVGSDGFDPLWCKSPNGPQML